MSRACPPPSPPATCTTTNCLTTAAPLAASALLGIKIGADWLLMLTDAEAVYDPQAWQSGERRPIPSPATCSQLRSQRFAAGSMAPKIAAACRFVEATGGRGGGGGLGLHGRRGRDCARQAGHRHSARLSSCNYKRIFCNQFERSRGIASCCCQSLPGPSPPPPARPPARSPERPRAAPSCAPRHWWCCAW